jgi:D-alanine--poly(phosphoribitol) ligase subunit 2
MTHARQKIYQKIVELAKQLGNDATSLRFQDSIPELGVLDSPALLELIVWFENEFGLEIEPEQLTIENFGTIDAIASYAEKAGK